MFFGKKEDKKKLPDLPPPKGSFGSIGDIGEVDRNSLFEDGMDSNSLPSFPDSPGHNEFSQAIIKDAVSIDNSDNYSTNSQNSLMDNSKKRRLTNRIIHNKNDESEEADREPYQEDGSKTVEIEEWKPSNFKMSMPERKEDPELEEPEEEEMENSDEEQNEENLAEKEIEGPPKFVKREYKSIKEEDRMENEQQTNKDIFVKIDKFYSARKSLQEIKGKFGEMNELIRKIREIKLREEQELSMWEKEMTHVKSRIQHVTENIFEKID